MAAKLSTKTVLDRLRGILEKFDVSDYTSVSEDRAIARTLEILEEVAERERIVAEDAALIARIREEGTQ